MKMNFNFERASVCLDHFLLVQKIFFIIGSIIDLEPRNERNKDCFILKKKTTRFWGGSLVGADPSNMLFFTSISPKEMRNYLTLLDGT